LYRHRIFRENENSKNQRTMHGNFNCMKKAGARNSFFHSNIYASVKLGLEMYGKEYHFSCTEIKETFSEYNLCNFSECPIKEKIEVERKAQTEFNYERCLEELSRIKPKVELRDRIPQATYFVNSEVLSKYGNLQEMELFIESEIFKYFDIPAGVNHPMSKIFRKGYNDLIKNKRKTQTNKIKTVEKEKTGTFDISEEFNGMYQKSISSTGNLIIEPFYDLIAKYVSDKLHTIVFHGNIFCYGDGCYSVNPYAVKAEATSVESILKCRIKT
jgi:hypothetical protein